MFEEIIPTKEESDVLCNFHNEFFTQVTNIINTHWNIALSRDDDHQLLIINAIAVGLGSVIKCFCDNVLVTDNNKAVFMYQLNQRANPGSKCVYTAGDRTMQ